MIEQVSNRREIVKEFGRRLNQEIREECRTIDGWRSRWRGGRFQEPLIVTGNDIRSKYQADGSLVPAEPDLCLNPCVLIRCAVLIATAAGLDQRSFTTVVVFGGAEGVAGTCDRRHDRCRHEDNKQSHRREGDAIGTHNTQILAPSVPRSGYQFGLFAGYSASVRVACGFVPCWCRIFPTGRQRIRRGHRTPLNVFDNNPEKYASK